MESYDKSSPLFLRINERIIDEHPGIWVGLGDERRHLTPDEARAGVRGVRGVAPLRDVVWARAIMAAQQEWPDRELALYFTLWLAEPWTRRVVMLVTDRLRVDRADVEAEMVASFLEELPHIDPDLPDAGETLLRGAARRVWPVARRGRQETAVADLTGFSQPNDPNGTPSDGWELEIEPPAGPDGLRAPIRFTCREQVKGERLGLLARDLGLDEVVHRARRLGEGRPVGRLSLRSVGSAR